MEASKLLIVLGATASGKTKLAVELADVLDAEIISADSRQIFTGMDLGTGKDLKEYNIQGKQIPYHLIDIKKPGEKYNVNEFKEDFYKVFEQLNSKGKKAILCGGTGMYIHSLLQKHDYTAVPVDQELRQQLLSLDKEELRKRLLAYPDVFTGHADHSSAKRLIRAIEIASYLSRYPLNIPERAVIKPLVIGLFSDVEKRRERIFKRLELRLETGMIEEVEQLLEAGVSKEMLVFYGLEYKFMVSYLDKEITYTELKEKLGTAICQFAKRQMTFFRKMEKDGVNIHWLNTEGNTDQLVSKIISLYKIS
ncbi:tRNA dimethylallyltransferase [Pedobacter sp. AK017]|uniref:tRNA (adenosine(37)-N6)-dimethylallyltransferase MiaA n=1 Tax=Pedobacter sp. AK017 TaxID=2723073 RepID=UPI001607BAF9|nr:tRNA (adenosine(37)-N6)-dimethylallyltransferase MiaA [Pedobacter sp. AK017]MBB5440388.1 tRNA dimethylallyltransferase [Pedobacter sp. AK017]